MVTVEQRVAIPVDRHLRLDPDFPHFTAAQVEAWAKTPEIQALKGALKESGIPADYTAKDIRAMRLAEKCGT
jgi:hypothetical protein